MVTALLIVWIIIGAAIVLFNILKIIDIVISNYRMKKRLKEAREISSKYQERLNQETQYTDYIKELEAFGWKSNGDGSWSLKE